VFVDTACSMTVIKKEDRDGLRFSYTDLFVGSYNRGYHDKGISVTIPFGIFTGKDSKTSYDFSLSPWTRDVAQDIGYFTNLFDYIGRNTDIFLKKDK
jgi:hypothetical protein